MTCSKRQVSVYLLALALAPLTANAAPLSITDAVGLAKKNNLELMEQRVQAETAERRIDAASVLFQENPEIEGEFGRRTGSVRSNDWAFRLSHPLPLSFARSKRIDAAEQSAKAQKYQYAAFSNRLVGEIRSLYHSVLALQEELEIAKQESLAAQRLSIAAEERARLGDIAPFEASLAKNEALIVGRRLSQSSLAFRNSMQSLNLALGLPVSAETLVELVLPPTASAPPQINRLEIAGTAEAQKAAESRLSAAKQSRFPTVRVFGGLEKEANTDRIALLGLSIPLPLYDRNQPEIAEASSEVRLREIDAIRARQQIERQVAAAELRYRAARELYLNITDEMRSPSMAPNLEEAFREGRISLNELIVAQRQQVELQRTIIEARLEYQQAWEEYRAAQGGFSDAQE